MKCWLKGCAVTRSVTLDIVLLVTGTIPPSRQVQHITAGQAALNGLGCAAWTVAILSQMTAEQAVLLTRIDADNTRPAAQLSTVHLLHIDSQLDNTRARLPLLHRWMISAMGTTSESANLVGSTRDEDVTAAPHIHITTSSAFTINGSGLLSAAGQAPLRRPLQCLAPIHYRPGRLRRPRPRPPLCHALHNTPPPHLTTGNYHFQFHHVHHPLSPTRRPLHTHSSAALPCPTPSLTSPHPPHPTNNLAPPPDQPSSPYSSPSCASSPYSSIPSCSSPCALFTPPIVEWRSATTRLRTCCVRACH